MKIEELTDDVVQQIIANTLKESTSFLPIVCVALAGVIKRDLEKAGYIE